MAVLLSDPGCSVSHLMPVIHLLLPASLQSETTPFSMSSITVQKATISVYFSCRLAARFVHYLCIYPCYVLKNWQCSSAGNYLCLFCQEVPLLSQVFSLQCNSVFLVQLPCFSFSAKLTLAISILVDITRFKIMVSSFLYISLPICIPLPLSLCTYLYLSLPIYPITFISLSPYISIYLYLSFSLYIPLHLSLFLPIYPFTSISLSPYISLYLYLSFSLYIPLPLSLSPCISLYLYLSLSPYLPLYLYLSLSLYIPLPLTLTYLIVLLVFLYIRLFLVFTCV